MLYTAIGQLIALALSFVLARLYTPADFGVYLLFANIFSFCNIAITFRFEQAILYVDTARRASTLVVLATVGGLCVAIVMMSVLLVAPPFGTLGTGAWQLAILVVASAWLSGAQRVIAMVLTRWRRFAAIARLNLIRPGIVGALQCGTGLFGPSGAMLALGHSVAYATLFVFACKQDRRLLSFVSWPSWKVLKAEATKSRHFPMYNMTQNLLFVASEAVVPLAIVATQGNAAGGLYWFAARVTTVPMQVLVESLRPIIYRDLAGRITRKQLVVGRMRRESAMLALPFISAAIVVWLCGEPVFGWLFSAKWTQSAHLAAVLLAFSAVHAGAVPAIATLPLIGAQRNYLLVEACVLVLRLIVFYLCSGLGTTTALAMSCAAAACVYLGFLAWIDAKMRGIELSMQSSQ